MTIGAEELDEKLKNAGYDIPLVDPNFAAIQMLESYIRMGLKQSRVTYAPLREKKLKWYGDGGFNKIRPRGRFVDRFIQGEKYVHKGNCQKASKKYSQWLNHSKSGDTKL